MPSIKDRIAEDVNSNDVLLFMKGTPVFPQCGFSAAVVDVFLCGAGTPSGRRLVTNGPVEKR